LCGTRQTHKDEAKQALIIHKASSNIAWQSNTTYTLKRPNKEPRTKLNLSSEDNEVWHQWKTCIWPKF